MEAAKAFPGKVFVVDSMGLSTGQGLVVMKACDLRNEGKSAEEICFLDFKQFTVNDTVFGVGQVNSMSAEELKEIRKVVEPHLEKARNAHGLDMIFFMLTNILTESSELLCCGPEAREKLLGAYDLPEDTEELMLKGVVSRKKQLVPALVSALQQ